VFSFTFGEIMSKTSFKISIFLPADPEQVFRDWLSSEGHTAITGSPATVQPGVGGKFIAWDGYISGVTLEMDPGKHILQAWRTTEFPQDSPDSRVEIRLEKEDDGTRLTLVHSEIPDGQAEEYLQGWKDYYFTPMLEYYSR
jgi:uncharacterized protein YndB with AHSA1/START domain